MQIDTTKLSPQTPQAPEPESRPNPEANTAPAGDAQLTPQTLTSEQIEELKEKIVAVLCTCFDPEIPVNIYELGLIYEIEVSPAGAIVVRMTLTSPACPAAGSLPPEVQHKVGTVPGVTGVKVDVVWDPPWDKNRMSEAAKLQLGIDD